MKGHLKIIGTLKEVAGVMTCEFLTNEANAVFVQNSEGVANFTSDGLFKLGKVVARSKPTYGNANEDCIIDTVSQAPNVLSICSSLNGVTTANIFFHTPFEIYIKIP